MSLFFLSNVVLFSFLRMITNTPGMVLYSSTSSITSISVWKISLKSLGNVCTLFIWHLRDRLHLRMECVFLSGFSVFTCFQWRMRWGEDMHAKCGLFETETAHRKRVAKTHSIPSSKPQSQDSSICKGYRAIMDHFTKTWSALQWKQMVIACTQTAPINNLHKGQNRCVPDMTDANLPFSTSRVDSGEASMWARLQKLQTSTWALVLSPPNPSQGGGEEAWTETEMVQQVYCPFRQSNRWHLLIDQKG